VSRHRRGHLLAVLSEDRSEALCGACGRRLAGIRPAVGSWFGPDDDGRFVALDVLGWTRRGARGGGTDQPPEEWWVPPQSRGGFLAGWPARTKFRARYPTWLPASAQCPACDRWQTLDPDVLDVDPNRRSGTARTGV
jgi:hypothetical protein